MQQQSNYKSIFESKTFWVSLGFLVLDILASPAVLNIIPVSVLVYLPAIQSVIAIALRTTTNQPVIIGTPAQAQTKNIQIQTLMGRRGA